VIEIASGLAPTDRVIENPPDGIGTGTAVHLAGATSVNADAGSAKHGNEKA
jgi:hypothetical protein